LAFLQAFTDDSASEVGDRRLFLAGYLNRAEQWALFSEAWDGELHAAPSIDYLHMVEAQNLRDQFDRRKGWDEAKRDEKLRGLARVIRRFKPISFQFTINREVFYRDLKPVSPRGLANPHFSACFGIVAGLAQYAESKGGNIPIDFIFDEQDGVSDDINLFFEHMKQDIPKAALRLINGNPIFKNDKQFFGLQAADMLVWHLRREHEICGPDEVLEMTGLLRSSAEHVMWEVTEPMIGRWADHHSKLPAIPYLQTKSQWRNVKKEIVRLTSLGIDPSNIGRKNVFQRAIDYVRKLFRD